MIEPGFNALFGPSGVGKTSFAKIITGDITDYDGEVRIDNMLSPLYSYNMERLPGWSGIGKHLKKITPAEKQDQMNELVQFFGLAECIDSRFSQLSLGQKNRINLIRYLLQDFDMLIMDESLANVDERTREKIILKIKDMYPDKFFLYISHNVIEVSTFCKEILVFRSAHKSPQTMLIRGQDHRTGRILNKSRLEQTMLEIMNAS